MRYKCRSQEGQIAQTGARWSVGTYFGVELTSGQHIVFDSELAEVRNARTILRVPEEQKWDAEAVGQVNCTPWQRHSAPPPEVTFRDQPAPRPEDAEERPSLVRRLYIRDADLTAHGFTDGCPK